MRIGKLDEMEPGDVGFLPVLADGKHCVLVTDGVSGILVPTDSEEDLERFIDGLRYTATLEPQIDVSAKETQVDKKDLN